MVLTGWVPLAEKGGGGCAGCAGHARCAGCLPHAPPPPASLCRASRLGRPGPVHPRELRALPQKLRRCSAHPAPARPLRSASARPTLPAPSPHG